MTRTLLLLLRKIPRGLIPFLPVLLAGMLLGVVAHSALRPRPAPLPPVILHDTVWTAPTTFNASRPDTAPGLVGRILHPVVRPEHTVASHGAAAETVSRFCAPARPDTVRIHLASTDSTPPRDSVSVTMVPPAPMVLITDLSQHRPFLFGRTTVRVWTARNDSAGVMQAYRTNGWDFSASAMGPEVRVRGDRLGGAKTWAERAVWMGIGAAAMYGAQKVVPR